jgi:hypothetical protein
MTDRNGREERQAGRSGNGAGNGLVMPRTSRKGREKPAEHYDRHGVLGEIVEGPAEFSVEEELRRQILEGRRVRLLQNISIKLDPAQIQALKKIATMKSIPYQTLIRQWLAEAIRKELRLTVA